MKEYKIKKGDRFLCIKKYKMEDGEIAYIKGKEYLSEGNTYLTDEQGDYFHKMEDQSNFFEHFQLIGEPKFEGSVDNLKQSESFYMVLVEGSTTAPKVKHDEYYIAFEECMRLSKQEGKTAFVLKAITEVEQIPNVKQLV